MKHLHLFYTKAVTIVSVLFCLLTTQINAQTPDSLTILSFSPQSATVGTYIAINGSGFGTTSGQSSIVAVTFSGIVASNFVVASDSEIYVQVPSGCPSYCSIEVQNQSGQIAKMSGFTFVVAPTISHFSHASATTGDTVIISGVGFAGTESVFFGGTAASSFMVVSDSTIDAIVGGCCSGEISIFNIAGSSSLSGFSFVLPSPIITSFTPTSTCPGSGSVIFITGNNFLGATWVSIGGTQASSFIVNSATSITATVQPNITGTIQITTPNGTATSFTSFKNSGGYTAYAYVTNENSNNVSVINTVTNTIIATVAVGTKPYGISISPNDSLAYVTNFSSNSVSVINIPTNSLTATVSVGNKPEGIIVSPDGTKAYVVNANSNNVSVINTNTNTVMATIAVGNNPTGISVSPDGSKVFVTNSNDNNVSVINAVADTIITNISVGRSPYGISISPDGSTVYVGNTLDSTVSIINTATNTVTATVLVGNHPNGICISPDGTKVYVANLGNGGALSIINAFSDTVMTNIALGSFPNGISIGPDGSMVYVTLAGSNEVSVINTASDTIMTTLAVGTYPVSFGNFIANLPTACILPPIITSFFPITASTGDTVIIKGSGFTGATLVLFGGMAANAYTVVNDSIISAVVGFGASGSVSVTVAGVVDTLAGFTYIKLPVIASFSPSSGSPGTYVYIQGIGFSGATSVSFGGIPASSFYVQDDNDITAVVGNGATGNITVTIGNDTISSAGFVFIAPPTITSFSPTIGTSGTPITIHGSGFNEGVSTYFGGVSFGSQTYTDQPDSLVVLSDSVLIAWVGAGSSGYVYVNTSAGTDSLAGFTFLPVPPIINSGWANVGVPGFTNSPAQGVTAAIGSDNIPYIAYLNSTSGQTIVMKYANKNWTQVGSQASAGKSTNLNLVLDNANNPIVAFNDSSNGGLYTVEKYNGTSWVTLGNTNISNVVNFSMAIDTSNNIYLFTGYSVYKLNNGNWITVGQSNFATANYSNNIAIDKTTNTPYVVFDIAELDDSTGFDYLQASVMKLVDSNWVNVGLPGFTSAPNGVSNLDIAVDATGTPLVSFQDDDGFERLSVYKFANGAWNTLGSPRFSQTHSYHPSFAIDKKNNPYILYDDATYDGLGSVRTFTNTGNWGLVGERGFAPNYYFTRHALIIDATNTPMIVFQDENQGGRASLMRYVGAPIAKFSIAGTIYNPLGDTIPRISVVLNGTDTAIASNYSFNVPADSNYTITPYKNNDIDNTNGVTVLDILLIQAHILDKILLNSPYKIIAADVNNDGQVSILDILYTKKLILGLSTTFPGNRLWSFVDSAYQFPNPTNPFPYQDSIKILNLSSNQPAQSFIGMKLGDVNFDWNPAILGTTTANKPLGLFYTDASVGSDGYLHVPIKVKDFNGLLGFQFTINYDSKALQLQRIENDALNIDYATNHSSEGKVSCLWDDSTLAAHTLADSTVLMELVFAQKGNIVNKPLSISSSITPIAAYDANFEQHNIVMTSSQLSIIKYQVSIYPNPAKDALTINGKHIAFVQVIDNMGRVVGVHTFHDATNPSISVSNLPTGIYHLRIQTTDGNVTEVGFVKQ